MLRTSLRSSQVRCIKHKPLIVVFKFAWHRRRIFAYSYNKFYATLTTRAQNRINAPTCVPETMFCCLKICVWDCGQPFVKSPGSSNIRPPCTYMKGKFPTPVNCLSGKFPGVSRGGGGWLLQQLTHALQPRCLQYLCYFLMTGQ